MTRTYTTDLELRLIAQDESTCVEAEITYEHTLPEYMAGAGWGRQRIAESVTIESIVVQIGGQRVNVLSEFTAKQRARMEADLLRYEQGEREMA